MSIRKDYSIDVLRLPENLKNDIGSKKNLGKLVFGLDKDACCFQIDQIRASMRREMKDAASLTRETERIMTDAEEEVKAMLNGAEAQADQIVREAEERASLILQQAELKQVQMVSEDEVLRIAKAQAEELRKTAERESREMRRGADHYAADVLENLANVVGKVLSSVERGKREIQSQIQPTTSAVVEIDRERVNV